MKAFSRFRPKIVLCVIGPWSKASEIRDAVGEAEHEFQDKPDARMERSFRISASAWRSSMDEKDFAAVPKHRSVVYALSKNYEADDAPAIAADMTELGARLLDAGGIAIKCESSGIAWSKKNWKAIAKETAELRAEFETEKHSMPYHLTWVRPLYRAYVRLPLSDAGDLYSCGMHLLGRRDGIIAASELEDSVGRSGGKAGGRPGAEDTTGIPTAELLDSFLPYSLEEAGEDDLDAGHTFRADEGEPRYSISVERCTQYEEDDFFFNPWGRFRLRRLRS